jgi:hypothetical protein
MKNKLLNAGYYFAQVFRFLPSETRRMKVAIKALVRGKNELARRLCKQTTITSICWDFAEKE